jgi:hypothetical protein
MRLKYFVYGVLVLLIFIIGCAEKECKTDSDCLTKDCFTVQCTDTKCVYSPISDCCGNEICEVGEIYPECVVDCPNCDDKNDCTIDEYDYHEQKCVNTIIPNVICCGNNACETGETYENCAQDCPNCDDDNECTKDRYDYHEQECVNEIIIPCCSNEICDEDVETYSSCSTDCPDCNDNDECTKDFYDYHEQKCINELIIPCCGNDICDEDAETFSSCATDCPNCDDNNRLTGDSFNYATQECEYVTYYLFDDFDEGSASWGLDARWSVTNGMLTNINNDNAYMGFGDSSWTDYTFKLKVKLEQGGIIVYVRRIGKEAYGIDIGEDQLKLWKDVKPPRDLEVKERSFDLNQFYDVKIEAKGNNIKVYIDGNLEISYTDTDNPLLSGHVSLESMPKSYFDDIIVEAP